MARYDIPRDGAREVEVVAQGDLVISGADVDRIVFDDEGDQDIQPPVTRTDDRIQIALTGDGRLAVPRALTVRVSQVAGDLRVANLDAGLEVEQVSGDLAVQGGVALDAGTISGDARVENVRGEVQIERVSGDAKLVDCRGAVTLEHVDGDLSATNLPAGLQAGHVGGDLRLRTSFGPHAVYDLRVHGNARLTVVGEGEPVSARFDLRSQSGRIAGDLPLQNAERTLDRLQGQLGDGSAQVQVTSDGPIILSAREGGFDWSTMGGFFGDFGKDFGKDLGKNLGKDFGKDFGKEFAEMFGAFAGPGGAEFEQRIREKAEKFGRQAEEVARKASERAQRHAERMAQQAERQSQRWGAGASGWWRTPTPPPPPPPPVPRKAANSEERLVVLRLLADGKISVEEAARLLDALG